jgi:hypothetical protein
VQANEKEQHARTIGSRTKICKILLTKANLPTDSKLSTFETITDHQSRITIIVVLRLLGLELFKPTLPDRKLFNPHSAAPYSKQGFFVPGFSLLSAIESHHWPSLANHHHMIKPPQNQ